MKAEKALRASEEFSRTVLESSADCIEVMDCAGRIEYVNGEGLRLMETAGPAAVMGGRWLDMWPERERAAGGGRHCPGQLRRNQPLFRLPANRQGHAEILGRACRSRPRQRGPHLQARRHRARHHRGQGGRGANQAADARGQSPLQELVRGGAGRDAANGHRRRGQGLSPRGLASGLPPWPKATISW